MATLKPLFSPSTDTTKQYICTVKCSTSTDVPTGTRQWVKTKNDRYKITITKSEYNLSKPYIEDCIVDPNTGTRSKAILGMKLCANETVIIYSDMDMDCKIILKGD